MTIKYLDAKRIQGSELSRHSTPVVIGGTSSGTGGNVWADGTQDGSDHTVWYDIRRGVTVGEDGHQTGNGVTGVANNSTNGGDGFNDHPTDTIKSQGGATARWGMRFKVTIDDIVTNSGTDVAVGIGMSSSNGDDIGGHQANFLMKFNNSTRKFYCTGKKGGSWDSNDSQFISEIGTNMMAAGTWYVTLWMPAAMSRHEFRCSVSQNSDYTTNDTGSGTVHDNDNWGNEDPNYGFVKYFRVGNSKPNSNTVDNHVYFKVEDVKLWNGTLDTSTPPTTVVDMDHSAGVPGTGTTSRYTRYTERNPLVIREEANWGANGTKIDFTPKPSEDKATLLASPTLLDENTIFEEVDSRTTYFLQSDVWKSKDYIAPQRGLISGDRTANDEIIDYINISSLGNAAEFGDLTAHGGGGHGAGASATRAVFAGGYGASNVIDYVTIATLGDAADFGDLTVGRWFVAGCSDRDSSNNQATRGIFCGSATSSYGNMNNIDYVTIASTGNATDFGDTSVARRFISAAGNSTRAVFAGGET